MAVLGIDCWNGNSAQVQSFKAGTNPSLEYPLLLNGSGVQSNYGISHDHSMVIDKDGIIQYSSSGVNINAIQNTIDGLITTAIDDPAGTVFDFRLNDNYPNPFNPRTAISFSVDKQQSVSLKIYNIQGKLIHTLVDANLAPGSYSVQWNGTTAGGATVAAGTYFYRFEGTERSVVKKMLFTK
ncbi:MAG: T9SS type A sorting domain-containing protein [Caldithrix sp.]|nr:T9SS type A sorting domain-containing protein [Caldithrix sp.]